MPIVVRSSAGELMPAEALEVVDVATPNGSVVPLAQVSRLDAVWRPAAIHHRDRSRIATVSSQLEPGFTFSDVTRGMSVADWWGVTDRKPNALFIGDVDADGFFALLTERLARL